MADAWWAPLLSYWNDMEALPRLLFTEPYGIKDYESLTEVELALATLLRSPTFCSSLACLKLDYYYDDGVV